MTNLSKTSFTLGSLAFAMMVSLFSATAFAEQTRIRLNFYGDNYRGDTVLKLKQEVRYQHPGINLRDLDLKRVILRATTARRRGQASLIVGGYQTQNQIVDRNRNVFRNPSPSSDGRWQLKLRGNFTVDQVILVVRDSNNNGGRLQFDELEVFKSPKFIESVETIYVGGGLVSAIKLAATGNRAGISSVEVRYEDGYVENLRQLEGTLRENREFIATFGRRGVRIETIRITSTTLSFNGSRARIHVSVGRRGGRY